MKYKKKTIELYNKTWINLQRIVSNKKKRKT